MTTTSYSSTPTRLLLSDEITDDTIICAAFAAVGENHGKPININDIYECLGFSRRSHGRWQQRGDRLPYQRIYRLLIKSGFTPAARKRTYIFTGHRISEAVPEVVE